MPCLLRSLFNGRPSTCGIVVRGTNQIPPAEGVAPVQSIRLNGQRTESLGGGQGIVTARQKQPQLMPETVFISQVSANARNRPPDRPGQGRGRRLRAGSTLPRRSRRHASSGRSGSRCPGHSDGLRLLPGRPGRAGEPAKQPRGQRPSQSAQTVTRPMQSRAANSFTAERKGGKPASPRRRTPASGVAEGC
jgi:hypothetical protein